MDERSPYAIWKSRPWYVKVVALTSVALLAIAIWLAFFERAFFVSKDCFSIGIWLATGFSLFYGAFFIATTKYAQSELPAQKFPLRKYSAMTRWVLMPMGMTLFAALVTSASVPCLLNKMVGTPFDEIFAVAGKQTLTGRSGGVNCYRVELAELSESWYGQLCVQSDDFYAIRTGRHLRLHGLRSWFGTEISTYAVLRDSQ